MNIKEGTTIHPKQSNFIYISHEAYDYYTSFQQNQKPLKPLPYFDLNTKYGRKIYFIRGLFGCIGGFLIHLVIGSLYQWGLINPYITSYFIDNAHAELTLKQTGIIFPIMMFCIGITMANGLSLGQRFGYVKVLIVSFFFSSACVFISSFFLNIYVFVILYALGFGLILGHNFMIPMKICNTYFVNKETYVNGFILIGTGIGSVVFGMFTIIFLNPTFIAPVNGLYVDDLSYVVQNVPVCLRWLSLQYLIIGTIGSLLLKPLIEFNKSQQSKTEKVIISSTIVRQLPKIQGICYSARQAMTSKIFYIHILIIVCASCGNLFINTNYKTYANQKIDDDFFLIMVGVVGAIANGFSRFFWSSLFNIIGYKLTMLLLLTVNITCLSTISYATQSYATYMIQFFIFNAVLGGFLVLAPTFSSLVFGRNIGPKIFGIFWCSFALGNFVQYIFIIFLQPIIGLDSIIVICLSMNILNLIIIFTYRFRAKWDNDTKYFRWKPLVLFDVVTAQEKLLVFSVVSNRFKSSLKSSYILSKNKLSDQD